MNAEWGILKRILQSGKQNPFEIQLLNIIKERDDLPRYFD